MTLVVGLDVDFVTLLCRLLYFGVCGLFVWVCVCLGGFGFRDLLLGCLLVWLCVLLGLLVIVLFVMVVCFDFSLFG